MALAQRERASQQCQPYPTLAAASTYAPAG